jgi:hypothetical protein
MLDENIVIQWLLEENEPSIRYKTLSELLDYSSDHEEIILAKEKVANCKNVERIFARRDEGGLFPHKPEYYGNWTTFNHLTILAELGIAGDDPRIWPIVDWILNPGDDKIEYFVQKEFGYAYILDEANLGSCGQVKFLSTLVRLGYLDDPRVKRMIDVFVYKGRFDGGYLCKWKKSKHKGQEPKSCLAATVPALYLYSVLPENYRNGAKYDALIDYFTSRSMIYSKVEPNKIIVDTKLSLFDGSLSQILMIAYSMCKLGLGNIPQMNDLWGILNNKPKIDGKYILEAANTKKAILIDKPGQPNKWITLYVLLLQKVRDSHAEN